MLIDSYPLQQAVFDSDIPAQMLAEFDEFGVTGSPFSPTVCASRSPSTAFVGPADYQGITFSAFRSVEHAAAILALGATPTDVQRRRWSASRRRRSTASRRACASTTINGFSYLAPYVTANVNLWPHTLALIANPDTLSDLTATQRNWLTERRVRRRVRSTDLTDDDAEMLLRLCDEGARFANASDADLAAMRAGVRIPSTPTMNRDPTTKAFIEQIDTLKEATDPGPGLDIPADCTGPARPHRLQGPSRRRRCGLGGDGVGRHLPVDAHQGPMRLALMDRAQRQDAREPGDVPVGLHDDDERRDLDDS